MNSIQRAGRWSARATGAAALAVAMILGVGQTALADSVSGQTGDYLFTDDSSHPGATCKYTQDSNDPNKFWISKITTQPPSLWWPDRNSNSNTEHGKVGWRFLVQYATTGPTHTREAQSPIQKATAYEDSQNPYGSSTKAPLTKMTVAFNGKARGANATWRAVVNAFWYKTNGQVMGNANHVIQFYAEKLPNGGVLMSANPYCDGLIQIV